VKHVERLTEINRLRNGAYCWLYCAYILAMHGPMNVKFYKCVTLRPCECRIFCPNKFLYILVIGFV